MIILAVPTTILLENYLDNKSEDLIEVSGYQFINPTPESNINLSYSAVENQNQKNYIYQFDFIFKIFIGIKPNFTMNDRIFNNTQIYISIKANHGLDFYVTFLVLNMTEFHVNNSQVNYQKDMKSPLRFENLVVKLDMRSYSEGEGTRIIGGGITLFQKEQFITVEDISDFSGNLYFRINENEYNLSYEILPDLSVNYSLNSTVGDLELNIGQITIMAKNKSISTQIGAISFPYAPGPQGYLSQSTNTTLTNDYGNLAFELLIGRKLVGSEISYEIIPYSEFLDQLKSERKDLWNKILRNSLLAIIGVGAVIGCMIKDQK